jgi:hypothetical protein
MFSRHHRIRAAVMSLAPAIIAALLGLSLLFVQTVGIAFAANTHSIDLEDGSNQYLSITGGSQTGLNFTGDFTIEVWANFETLGTQTFFVARDDSGSTNRAYNFYKGSDDKLYLEYFNSAGSYSDFITDNAISVSTGQWVHLAVSADVDGTSATFYVNGTAVSDSAPHTNATSINSGSIHLLVGARDRGGIAGPMDGKLDEVRVWNFARSGTEINDDKDNELNGNETGLVAYWKLNNGLTDTTANGNTLTNNNSAVFSTDNPFSPFSVSLKVSKTVNESLASSTTLQDDDQLKLSLDANKTYMIDGVIFASSTSATPDILIAFLGQTGFEVAIGYTNDVNEAVLESSAPSSRINLPANTPTSVHIHGTVKTGAASGDLQLKWSQATSNAAATTVMKGSYLRAEAI